MGFGSLFGFLKSRKQLQKDATTDELTDRENDLLGKYGLLLEKREGWVGRESDLPASKAELRAALEKARHDPVYRLGLPSVDTCLRQLDTYVPDAELTTAQQLCGDVLQTLTTQNERDYLRLLAAALPEHQRVVTAFLEMALDALTPKRPHMPSGEDYQRILELYGPACLEQAKKTVHQLAKSSPPSLLAQLAPYLYPDLHHTVTRWLTAITSASPDFSSQCQESDRTFDTDIRDGDVAEIIAISPEDGYFGRRDFFIGGRVTVKNPIHKGGGWYSVDTAFWSGSRQIASFADGVLFASVRLRRI